MKINIVNLKVDIDNNTKEYIDKKLKRIEKYFNDEVEVKVVLKLEGKKKKIEVTIPTKNFIIRSEEVRDELEEATDIVIDKIERQIRKNKTRMNNKIDKTKYADIKFDDNDEIEDNNSIIKRKVIDTKPMSEEEAILQMELLNHDFYMFKNMDTDSISVIYKRHDGNYGLIDSK